MVTSTLRVVLFLLCVTAGSTTLLSEGDPCGIYSTYIDTWRDPRKDAPPVHCDRIRHISWYSFLLGYDRAYIPNATCMQDNTCGGEAAYFVNLEGAELPQPGETINTTLCVSARVLNTMACCAFRHEIQIKHCQDPDAFIYYLPKLDLCNAAICAIPVEQEELDERYMFKSGQLPRSLQTTTTTSPPDISTADIDECSLEPFPCQNGTCINTPGGFICQCDLGFKPDLNDTVCRDIDECLAKADVCPGGRCRNTLGSYLCACPVGYRLDVDTQGCIALTTMSSWNTTDMTSQETTTNESSQGQGRVAAPSCFTEYRPLLIAAIVVIVLCTLVFVCMRLRRRYRKRGTWRPPPDRKGDEEAAEGLGTKTADAANGSHQHGAPAAGSAEVQGADGEDNWWVVPLDQAPEEAAVGRGQNKEDTRM